MTMSKCTCDNKQIVYRGERNPVPLDRIWDPIYNVKGLIKQSLLLEDHLLDPKKRCHDCIAKHFLTMIALSEEAVSLAGTDIRKFPTISENPTFYNSLFELWRDNRNTGTDLFYSDIADLLRKRRKVLVSIYVL